MVGQSGRVVQPPDIGIPGRIEQVHAAPILGAKVERMLRLLVPCAVISCAVLIAACWAPPRSATGSDTLSMEIDGANVAARSESWTKWMCYPGLQSGN